MVTRIPLVLAGALICLLPIVSSSLAQDNPPPQAIARVPLDQILAQISKVESDLAKKVDEINLVINAEVGAKRLMEPTAQSLRWNLRSALAPSAGDSSSIASFTPPPTGNEALVPALKSFEIALPNAQRERAALIQSAMTEARLRVVELTRTAQNPSVIDPVIETLARFQEALQSRTLTTSTITGFFNFETYLRALRQVVELGPKSDPLLFSSALSQLQTSSSRIRSALGENDLQQRVEQTLAPLQKAQEDAQQALDKLLFESAPAEAVKTALAAFERSALNYQQSRSGVSSRITRDTTGVLNVYRNLIFVAEAFQKGQSNTARNALANLRSSNFQPLDAERAAKYSAQLSAWEKASEEQSRQAEEKLRVSLGKRIQEIKNPAELARLAVEILPAETSGETDRGNEKLRALANELGILAAAWSSNAPQLVSRGDFGENLNSFLRTELADLRQRIARDVFAQNLSAPELNQPPLANQPLATALENLAGQLAVKGEWRRLLLLVDTNSSLNRLDGSMTRNGDLALALRAFIAGQNLETAEQWADAVQSYKNVLRCTSEYAPIKETAARLKALAKDHPEAFPASPANSRPNAFPQ